VITWPRSVAVSKRTAPQWQLPWWIFASGIRILLLQQRIAAFVR
jgi:hypothetical protein